MLDYFFGIFLRLNAQWAMPAAFLRPIRRIMTRPDACRTSFVSAILCGISLLAIFLAKAVAEEGMWTVDNPPVKQLKERYGFEPSKEWLEHIRLSSVRFNDGGSGSFVSPNGLALTNHHVALGQLQKLSTAEKDFVKVGFHARTLADELNPHFLFEPRLGTFGRSSSSIFMRV